MWSKVWWETKPLRANGEITTVGTRKPRRLVFLETSWACPGGTWSKKPPHSSYVITRTVLAQPGPLRTASYTSFMKTSPARMSAWGWSSLDRPLSSLRKRGST